MANLTNKHIIIGITGGIAAYKSAELVRRLRDEGAQVRVVMTKAAQAFIAPLTFQALSGNAVHSDLFDLEAEAAMGHIELARWADCVVIAPASADFIAKLAHGFGSDLLTTLCLATEATIAIAPAMNKQMWDDSSTQDNIKQLTQKGISIWGPAAGSQACGEVGLGRMLEPPEIILAICSLFQSRLLEGIRILITAGPTQENIDPVRYISNRSSGKMGYAIAQAAVEAGANVTLITGPVNLPAPQDVECITVETALEMRDAVLTEVNSCDIFIAAAAVADYRCKTPHTTKLAKTSDLLTLELIKNPDIVAEVAALHNKPFVVGFAAETDDVVIKATHKLSSKKLNMIAANQVGLDGQGFETDRNALTILWSNGTIELPLMNKFNLAKKLLHIVKERYEHENNSIKNFG